MGALKPIQKISVSGEVREVRRILICHEKSDLRKLIRQAVERYSGVAIEESDDGQKAYNRARTMKDELFLVIVHLCIPVLDCSEMIRGIRELPHHKRAKFFVCFDNTQKEQLVPLVRVGVRDFVKESELDELLRIKLDGLGLSRAKEAKKSE
jgi:CheY-like chemotaxis protein